MCGTHGIASENFYTIIKNSQIFLRIAFFFFFLRKCVVSVLSEMENTIIYNGNTTGPIYDQDMAPPHHHEQQHLVNQQESHHIVHHENTPVTTASSTNYDSSCWHFMPPDYPYYPEDDFRCGISI